MNDKHLFTLDAVSSIDDDIIDKNLQKRFELWFKKGRRKTVRWVPIVAAAACLCILFSVLVMLMPGGNGKQVPVYRGMTVSNEPPVSEHAQTPATTYPTFSLLSTSTMPPYDISLLGEDDDPLHPTPDKPEADPSKPEADPSKPGKDENKAPDIVFGQTYYAMKNEDIYIHIHLSNPDEFEILSFTLNGKKYSSNMFEYGSDLQTLILKYNVGNVDGLQEYTIDAIKYVDGEKIKDVRMEGDKTVKVYVNDDQDTALFNAQLSFTTLTIAPTKPLLSLALYEDNTLLRTLSPTDTEITDLPFGARLILKATYSDGTQTRTAQYIFDMPALSQGLIIDEEGIIRGIGSCTDKTLYINNPVGDFAFYQNRGITTIHMGPGVTSIGEEAFAYCSTLTTVQLSDTLTEVKNAAFASTGITSIAIPDSLTYLAWGMFSYCEKLSEVTLHDGIQTIAEMAFAYCSSLASIALPDGLNTIGNSAFAGCTGLTSITLPDSVNTIDNGAFGDCTGLTSIILPDGVHTIGEATFFGCTGLTCIILPDGVHTIGDSAFYGCTGLTSITLPASLNIIERDAFGGCSELSELYFEGTKAQWGSISKDKRWKGDLNQLATVHCSDGDVQI